MQTNQHIFVYGLLMFPEVVHALTAKNFLMVDAGLRDYRRYGLTNSPFDAPVPVLVAEPGGYQQGKLLLDVDPASVALLDLFEEIDAGHYIKQQVRVESAGQWYSAFCYAAGPALLPYADGDWQPELVSAGQKAHLVTSVIPAWLQTLTSDKP